MWFTDVYDATSTLQSTSDMEPLETSALNTHDVVLVAAYLNRYYIYPSEEALKSLKANISDSDYEKAAGFRRRLHLRDDVMMGSDRRYWRAHWQLDTVSLLLHAPSSTRSTRNTATAVNI